MGFSIIKILKYDFVKKNTPNRHHTSNVIWRNVNDVHIPFTFKHNQNTGLQKLVTT